MRTLWVVVVACYSRAVGRLASRSAGGQRIRRVEHEPRADRGRSRRAHDPARRSEPAYAVLTDENGKFEIDARHAWGLYSPLGEGFPVTGTIEFAAPGYATEARPVSWPQTGRAAQNVGIVELEPMR
jgi:hypothetical protein